MDGWIWPDHDYAWLAFFVLDGLGAAAAVATGRAFARSWSPQWQIAPASTIIAGTISSRELQELAKARPVELAAAAPSPSRTKNANQP